MTRRDRWLVGLVLLLGSGALVKPVRAAGEEDLHRKIRSQVVPTYPEIARKMSIGGSVKLVVVVTPEGKVKNMRVMGGHPLLVNAAEDALRKWKFEPAPEESTGVVEFKFKPQD